MLEQQPPPLPSPRHDDPDLPSSFRDGLPYEETGPRTAPKFTANTQKIVDDIVDFLLKNFIRFLDESELSICGMCIMNRDSYARATPARVMLN